MRSSSKAAPAQVLSAASAAASRASSGLISRNTAVSVVSTCTATRSIVTTASFASVAALETVLTNLAASRYCSRESITWLKRSMHLAAVVAITSARAAVATYPDSAAAAAAVLLCTAATSFTKMFSINSVAFNIMDISLTIV